MLCGWWAVNSAREFFGDNFREVADCLTNGRTVASDAYSDSRSEAGYLFDGELRLRSVTVLDKNLAAHVLFSPSRDLDAHTSETKLTVTFSRAASAMDN